MGDVIIIGNIASDYFLDSKWPETKKEGLPSVCYPVGAKIFVEEMGILTGGGGFNSSVTFSRMGLKTSYFGKIMKDSQGEKFLKDLRKEKIKFIGIRGKGIGAHSIILDTLKHHRTIFVFKGKDNNIHFKNLKGEKPRWFYFSSMIKDSLKAQQEFARYAKKNGIKVAYNPSEYLIRGERKAVLKLVKKIDVLILNKEEAELLTGSEEKVSEKLIDLGPEIICITDGKNGAIAYDCENSRTYSVLTNPIKVKETAGAGDAFASGFISALIKGKELKFALELGITNAEKVIQYTGASEKILTWDEALREIKRRPHKVRVAKW